MAQQCYDKRILPDLFISDVSNVEFKIARPHTKKVKRRQNAYNLNIWRQTAGLMLQY